MSVTIHSTGQEIRQDGLAFRIVAARISEYRSLARPEVDITREINDQAAKRLRLYSRLASFGRNEETSEQIAALNRRLDNLYEELRITRMVAE